MASERRVAGAIRSLVNAKGICNLSVLVSYKTMLVPVLIYGTETMLLKEK